LDSLGSSIIQMLLMGSLAIILGVICNLIIYVYSIKATYNTDILKLVVVLIVFWIVSAIVSAVLGMILSPFITTTKATTQIGNTFPAGGNLPPMKSSSDNTKLNDDMSKAMADAFGKMGSGGGKWNTVTTDKYSYSVSEDGTAAMFSHSGRLAMADCDGMPKRVNSMCVKDVAEEAKDPSLCARLDESDKSSCISKVAVASNDQSLCAGLGEGFGRDTCYEDIAEKMKDKTICDRIQSDFWKKNCIQKATKQG
jgi:hypothetical protein